MPQVVDPPFVTPNPQTSSELAKRIVRKSLTVKKYKARSNGAPYFTKVEKGLSGLWDHINGDMMKELNRISSALESANAGNGDPQALANAVEKMKQAKIAMMHVANLVGAAQSSVRHVYAGSNSGFTKV